MKETTAEAPLPVFVYWNDEYYSTGFRLKIRANAGIDSFLQKYFLMSLWQYGA